MAKTLMAMLFLFLAIHLTMVGSRLNVGYTEPPVPAVYIFGDSIFDVGTNTFLNDSKSRADQPFYGIDFPHSKATGRFSNGYNTADRLGIMDPCYMIFNFYKANLLGFPESPPPYLYLALNDTENFNSEILKGVNFASGGSGILDATGQQFVRVVPLSDQIQQFRTVYRNISQYLNSTAGAEARINKSLFLVSVGSNDILEFFQKNISQSPKNNATQMVLDFIPFLMGYYQYHLTNLINHGAKKLGIVSVPAIGCIPIVRATSGGNCLDGINAAAQLFHSQFQYLLLNLSSKFSDLKYSLGNTYAITYQMIDNPAPLRLSDVTSSCCGNKTLTSGTPCSPEATLCENRNSYLFWDEYHPTSYASKIAALGLFSGATEYVAPTNFSVLVQPS